MKLFDSQDRMTIATWRGSSHVPLPVPLGLAVDAQSRLFVSDAQLPQVIMFSPDGEPVIALGTKLMKRPAALAVDDHRGRLYVADTILRKILVYDLNTLRLVTQIGGPIPPAEPAPDTLSTPAILLVAPKGELLVLDTVQCRIAVFDEHGEFVRNFGESDDQPGRLGHPEHTEPDSAGLAHGLEAAFGNSMFRAYWQLLVSEGSGGGPGHPEPPGSHTRGLEDRPGAAGRSTSANEGLQHLPVANQQAAAASCADEQRLR